MKLAFITIGLLLLAVAGIAIKIWGKKEFKPYQLTATISFMAVTCYAVDAFLNFPAERTAMQSILAIAAALICIPISYQQENVNVRKSLMGVFFSIALLAIIPSIYVHKLTYDSLKIQKFVMGEVNADPVMKTEESP
mgnify:CR=1 FL=1